MFKRIKNYLIYRDTIRQLNNLTDRDLADIGLTRGDICFIAKKQRKHSD